MRSSRAAGMLIAMAVLAGPILLRPQGAVGQEPLVAVTLRAQTPVTTLEDPVVTVQFSADNLGDVPIDELSVGLSIGSAIRSRVAYVTSLAEGPGDTPIFVQTFSQTGTLEPGESRRFSATADLGEIDLISEIDSAVYPARVDLRVAGTPIASIDTPLVHIVRDPDVPLESTWWTELDAPVAIDPAGRLADPSFEVAIAPGGTLERQVAALEDAVARDDRDVAVTVVIVPAVIDQLARLSDGYERALGETVADGVPPATHAAEMLADLRRLVSDDDVHVVVAPFAGPLLPSLASGGLAGDMDRQQDLGETTVTDLLGLRPEPSTARPPTEPSTRPASTGWRAVARLPCSPSPIPWSAPPNPTTSLHSRSRPSRPRRAHPST